MIEPNRRHPLGKHEQTFAADAARLRDLFAAGIPVIAVGMGGYRVEGQLPAGFDLGLDGEEDR